MNENYLVLGLCSVAFIIILFAVVWYLKKRRLKKYQVFWEDKKIRCQYYLNYKGQRQGIEIFYFRNGNLNKKRYWANNVLNGVSQVYYTTGELYIESNYKEGKLDGVYTVYFKDKNIVKREVYESGLLTSTIHKLTFPNYKTEKSDASIIHPIIDENTAKKYSILKKEYHSVKTKEETKDDKKSKKGFLAGLQKVGRIVVGVEAYQCRNSAKSIKESCASYYDNALHITESTRNVVNKNINEFGKYRLTSLRETTGKFLGILKDLDQENRLKEYKILNGIGIDIQTIGQMKKLDMDASKALKSSATVGAIGAAAAMGTPALVTSTVGALATASTGTAISALSGAAATNATLAWLGGGSLVTGGGGMAAGATVLSAVTVGATAGVGLVATGLIASTYYSKKLTEAKDYQKQVESKVADMEKLWIILNGINKRTDELRGVTQKLEERLLVELEFLVPLSVDFDTSDVYYNTIFQRVAIMAKGMSELAQTPLLDDEGNASSVSERIIQDTYTILNTKLINYG